MKNDSSRNTFNARKHFSGVRMQQGRVQLDADWNEQSDIITHRDRTETADIIGWCGGPLHHAAFYIVADRSKLTAEEQGLPENKTLLTGFQAPDFLIRAGRYYVDGILCENEQLTSYLNQPDLPGATLIKDAGLYLVYVDVWQRHVTALDDPAIREIALGGPDTATRTKTIWQVKYWFAGANTTGNCLTEFEKFEGLIAAGNGKLSARTKQEQTSTSPCIVSPGAGYRGLENQLYRVEVHQDGEALDVTSGGAGTLATRVSNTNNQVKFSGGSWEEGQAIEIFSSKVGSDPMNGTLAYITKIDGGSKTLTLNINVSDIALDELRLRPVSPANATYKNATYKWSRNNGVVVTTIENINGQEITVHDLGPDAVLGFKEGQWVEIIDDRLELNGLPGQLAQIGKIDRAINLITLNFAPARLAGGIDKTLHPKLRGWDGIGAIKFHPKDSEDHFLDLENGVQVRFFAGTFKSGDYWTIPARTATADKQSGNIEWPQDASSKPLKQLPFGIKHHYCRLAMLLWNDAKKTFDVVEDCRNLFPPVTELTSLFYVSGDGQEVIPGQKLSQPLQVRVANGAWPVGNAQVHFDITVGNGMLDSADPTTGADGIASCNWTPDGTAPSQQVKATLTRPALHDPNGNPISMPIFFNASLNTALYYVSGDGQEVIPGQKLSQPLQVRVANGAWPVDKAQVNFAIKSGVGKLNGQFPSADVTTEPDGIASCDWTPDSTTPSQQVEATLTLPAFHDLKDKPISMPIRFNASLIAADQVTYNPPASCTNLTGVTTVRGAIDKLCEEAGVHVTGVFVIAKQSATGLPSPQPLLNNDTVSVGELNKGLQVTFDAPVNLLTKVAGAAMPLVYGAEAFFVTLYLPVDINGKFTAINMIGYQPLLLDGAFSSDASKQQWTWTPTPGASTWLVPWLYDLPNRIPGTRGVRAQLTLKGNFIVSTSGLYLDGEAFFDPHGSLLNKRSGDGRRGGNFEMWFWLAP